MAIIIEWPQGPIYRCSRPSRGREDPEITEVAEDDLVKPGITQTFGVFDSEDPSNNLRPLVDLKRAIGCMWASMKAARHP